MTALVSRESLDELYRAASSSPGGLSCVPVGTCTFWDPEAGEAGSSFLGVTVDPQIPMHDVWHAGPRPLRLAYLGPGCLLFELSSPGLAT